MTEQEKQEIVAGVLQALKTNSLTLDQLSETAECSDSDFVELSKGRKISAENLSKHFVDKEFSNISERALSNKVLTGHINKMTTEYNVSVFHPGAGIGGTNEYTLETAIAKIPEQVRNVGLKCSFLDDAGRLQTWEFTGGEWAAGSFSQVGAGKLSELDKGKQDRLTFDESPVEGSGNPVTSGGIRQALDAQKKEVDAARDTALANISEKEQDAISNFSSQRVTPEMLSEATRQLVEQSGEKTINNLPDDEDLTTTGGELPVLKFADRAYSPANFSGKGYKILRRNIVDGKNVLTQDMISGANTVYEIRYDFDLNGSSISISEKSILLFQGGSIKNGTILFGLDSNIVNVSGQTIFYDVKFSIYSKLSIDCHFIDNWHNNPMLSENHVIVNAPHFYFTKDYIIEDDAHFSQGSNNNIPHYLHGNGHTVRMLTHNFTGKNNFLQGESISIDNLSIICVSEDREEHIGTLFDCRNFTADNVYVDAYNRLAANWSYDDYIDHDNSYMTLRNCDIMTSSFVMENRYDRLCISNSRLRERKDKSSDYGHDIISVRAYNSNPTDDNAYIYISNSVVEGGIELVGTQAEARTNTYKKITVLNSILRYFRLGFHGGDTYGITDMEVINSVSYVGLGNGFYNGINSVTYRHCSFFLTTYNAYALGPFKIQAMRSFTFEACTFNADAGNDSVYAPICETHAYTSYRDDFADIIEINIINCNISIRWIGEETACISLKTNNIVFTDAQAERAINIKNTKLIDIGAETVTAYASIVYASDENKAYPRLLPIDNFRLSYESVPRLKLNMMKGKNISGEFRSHFPEKWGNRIVPVTYFSSIQQFIQSNGISWNSVRPLI